MTGKVLKGSAGAQTPETHATAELACGRAIDGTDMAAVWQACRFWQGT